MILDCDPGHDDALAIMLAAAHPAAELLAISTVAGNQTLDKTMLNARRICDVAGITDVPVVTGRAQPLHGPGIVASDVHGESGLDGPRFGLPVTEVATLLLAAPDVTERIDSVQHDVRDLRSANTLNLVAQRDSDHHVRARRHAPSAGYR